MKKILLALTIGIIIGAIPSAFAVAKLFSDVNEGQWYSDAVYNLTEKSIIEGYEDNTFKPSNNVNRAELTVMLDRLLTYIDSKKGPLSKFGAFTAMQSYEGCMEQGLSFDELTDYDLTLNEWGNGELIWHSDFEYYCDIDLKTGDVLTYYFMEY